MTQAVDRRAWLCGRRLMSIDGVELDAPDTPANEQRFGRKSGKCGTGAFAKVLVSGRTSAATTR